MLRNDSSGALALNSRLADADKPWQSYTSPQSLDPAGSSRNDFEEMVSL
jgi:hypothetical protein